jgi:hypothetical protein
MSDTTRLQVDVLKHQLEEMDKLMRLGGLRSKREFWDTAFTLLKWASKKKAQGLPVGSLNGEGVFSELEMPFLEHYATSVREEQAQKGDNEDVAKSVEEETNVAAARARKNGTASISLAKRKQA